MPTPVEQFRDAVLKGIASFPGWSVRCLTSDPMTFVPMGAIAIQWCCPHGDVMMTSISAEMLTFMSVPIKQLVGGEIQQVISACASQHVDKPVKAFLPAGTRVKGFYVTLAPPPVTVGLLPPLAAPMSLVPASCTINVEMVLDSAAAEAWQNALTTPAHYPHPSKDEPEGTVTQLARLVPALKSFSQCPECHDKPDRLYGLIVHLNDAHRWTREAIAGWLDTLDIDLTIQLPKGA